MAAGEVGEFLVERGGAGRVGGDLLVGGDGGPVAGFEIVAEVCYSSYARGTEFLMDYYAILDRVPRGRGEDSQAMSRLRRHDEYSGQ